MCDLLDGNGQFLVKLLRFYLCCRMGDVLWKFGCYRTGLDDDDAYVGLQLLTKDLRPTIDPALGGRIDGPSRAEAAARRPRRC